METLTRNNRIPYIREVENIDREGLVVGNFVRKERNLEWIDGIGDYSLRTLSIGNPHGTFIYTRYYTLMTMNDRKQFCCVEEKVYSPDDKDYNKLKNRIEAYKSLGAGI